MNTRVRAMFDEGGWQVKSVGPSMTVVVLGLSGTPNANDDVLVVADERKAREVAAKRESRFRDNRRPNWRIYSATCRRASLRP